MWPQESQHARPPCASQTPGVYSDSCPLSQWCHPAISSSVIPFSSCPQSLQASGSFPMSQLFTSGGQRIGVSASASVPPMSTQDWSPSGWTGCIRTSYIKKPVFWVAERHIGHYTVWVWINELGILEICFIAPLLLLFSLCPIWLFCDPMDCSLQVPLSMGSPRQEYWSGLLFLFQGIFVTQGLNPYLLHWQADSLPLSQKEALVAPYLRAVQDFDFYHQNYIFSGS